MQQGEPRGEQAPEGMAAKSDPGDAQRVEEPGQTFGVVDRCGGGLGKRVGGAIAGRVPGNDVRIGRHCGDHRQPGFSVAADPV